MKRGGSDSRESTIVASASPRARLQDAHALVRSRVAFYNHDRYFAPDIGAIQTLVESGEFHRFVPGLVASR